MKRLLIALFLLVPTLAFAQSQRNPCFYTAANPGPGNGCIPVSTANPLPVTSSGGGGGGAATIADGADVAEGATTDTAATPGSIGTVSSKLRLMTSQNDALLSAVLAGIPAGTNYIGQFGANGVFNTTLPTLTSGQRGDIQLTSRGQVQTVMSNAGGTLSATVALLGNSSGQSGANPALSVGSYNLLFNSATWDTMFTCPNTAAINVTAGSTTQIVALSGTTITRVCSITVSMSAAGTFNLTSGTGTNCATPAGALPAMALATGNPFVMVAPSGGSIYRSTAGGEICVTAATGNAVGWITYAQF